MYDWGSGIGKEKFVAPLCRTSLGSFPLWVLRLKAS